MTHQRHRTIPKAPGQLWTEDGFTLIELALAVAIVGVLAALAVPNYLAFVEKARVARAVSELHALAKDIHGFALGAGHYPDSLAQIARGTLLDPWGTPYEYWRVNCGPVDDIPNLAHLHWPRDKGPQITPAVNTHPIHGEPHMVFFAVDARNPRGHLFFVQGNGGGNGNGNGGGNGGGGGNGNGGGGQNCGEGGARKDRHLHPISSDFDLYSMGKDRDSVKPLTAQKSHDDVIRASDGGYYGLARNF